MEEAHGMEKGAIRSHDDIDIGYVGHRQTACLAI